MIVSLPDTALAEIITKAAQTFVDQPNLATKLIDFAKKLKDLPVEIDDDIIDVVVAERAEDRAEGMRETYD